MCWPKGVPHTQSMVRKRTNTLSTNKIRHKKADSLERFAFGKCKQYKHPQEFHSDKRTPNGLKSQCKICHQNTSIRTRNMELHKASKVRSESRRRARIFNAAVSITKRELECLNIKWGDKCLCCGAVQLLQWDHITPLSKGGSHAIDNLQRLCRSCNEIKQARFIDYRSYEQKVWVVEFERITP